MRRMAMTMFSAAILLGSGFVTGNAVAQQRLAVTGCVTPKATVDRATGRLVGRHIDVFERPDPQAAPIWIKIGPPMPLAVVGRSGAFVRIAGTPESPFREGAAIGWVRAADVEPQDQRNCN